MCPQLPQHQSAAEKCPAGFSWYSCSTNKFGGCCSVDACAEGGGTCPDLKQPLTPATSSTLAPTVTTHSAAHPPPLTSAEVSMSSTETPRVVISVGAPVAVSATPNSSNNPTVMPTTFVTIAATHPADSTPLTSAPPSAIPAAAAANNTGANNNNSFPIGLIAGIVTGFSILILVMSALFVFLWRNKRIKAVSDDEATELRDRRRAATRAYYMPQPPTPQQQRMVATGGGDASPQHVRAAPPEVVTPRRVATSSPRRSSCSIDTNKPWPLTPLATVYRTSPSPLREGASGRGFHAMSFTPAHAASDQRPQSYPTQGQGPCTPAASTTILDDTLNNGQQQQRTSELARTSSVLYALSPPPRRPRPSDASEKDEEVVGVATTSEGYIGATPSLRLSGCGGSSLEVNHSHHPDCQDDHAEDMSSVVSHSVSQRKTWCGEGGDGDGDQTSSLSGCGPSASRRCSR